MLHKFGPVGCGAQDRLLFLHWDWARATQLERGMTDPKEREP